MQEIAMDAKRFLQLYWQPLSMASLLASHLIFVTPARSVLYQLYSGKMIVHGLPEEWPGYNYQIKYQEFQSQGKQEIVTSLGNPHFVTLNAKNELKIWDAKTGTLVQNIVGDNQNTD